MQNDKYVNEVGVQAIKTWVEGKTSPIQTDLDALENQVDGIVNQGGEPNTINTVKVNGSALTPDSDKAVDVVVPTKTSDLTNDGDGTSNFATEAYVASNGGKIDKIKVNGEEQAISNKEVDITVPTAQDIDDAIDAKVAGAYKFKGSVANAEALPTTGNTEGDIYNVEDTGANYAWNGTEWDSLGGSFDSSGLWAKSELVAMTTEEVNAILNA